MREFDSLPPALRAWVARAALPWSARSVRQAYSKALSRNGDPNAALAALDALQLKLLAKDARKVWSDGHPACGADEACKHRAVPGA